MIAKRLPTIQPLREFRSPSILFLDQDDKLSRLKSFRVLFNSSSEAGELVDFGGVDHYGRATFFDPTHWSSGPCA
jgi:hypothetical protein